MVKRRRRTLKDEGKSRQIFHRPAPDEEEVQEERDDITQSSRTIIVSVIAIIALILIGYYAIPWMFGPDQEEMTVEQPPQPAAVEVLNGCGELGIAGSLSDFLRENNIDVVNTDNADNSDYAETIVIGKDRSGEHARAVARLMDVTNITYLTDTTSIVNVTIILGNDYRLFKPFKQ
ncbi:LytR C-terminal domain-containing protein [candidate division KSB1 bacterium]